MPLSIQCPSCGEPVEVDDRHRGWTVRCPICREEFVAGSRPDPEAGTPPNRDRDDDRDRDRDDDRNRPRRRHRYGPEDFADAAREVAGPATWLEVVGWGSAGLTLLAAVALILVGSVEANNPQQQPGDDPTILIVMGTCLGVFGLPYFGAIAYGGRHLRRMTSHGWAMASAIMAIGSIVLFGLCGVLVIGPGIWALVVLQRPHVRAAFEANAHGHDGY